MKMVNLHSLEEWSISCCIALEVKPSNVSVFKLKFIRGQFLFYYML